MNNDRQKQLIGWAHKICDLYYTNQKSLIRIHKAIEIYNELTNSKIVYDNDCTACNNRVIEKMKGWLSKHGE
jgi:hypothetical protein